MAREPRHLGQEGIIVLGHYEWDLEVAARLGLPRPRSGEWISVRVYPVESGTGRPSFSADDQLWAIAHDDEPAVQAPVIPRSKPLSLIE
jgi:hypothetical protein